MKHDGTRQLAVITGATGGIGKEICRRVAMSGFDILAQYHSDRAAAEALQREVEDNQHLCRIVQADLASEAGVASVCSAAEAMRADSSGTLEIRALVNNAARLLGPSFDEATVADFDAYMALNARAPFFLSQRLSRNMPPAPVLCTSRLQAPISQARAISSTPSARRQSEALTKTPRKLSRRGEFA